MALILIGLPGLALVAAAVVARTADVSTVEGLDRHLGQADALVAEAGTTGPIARDPLGGGDAALAAAICGFGRYSSSCRRRSVGAADCSHA